VGGDGSSRLVVVGVDRSDASKVALRWAVHQAGCTGGQVEAVLAWNYPPYNRISPVIDDFDYEARAKEVLESSISDDLGLCRPADLRTSVVHGNAARVLSDASRGAALLVVGNRGYGGFTEMLLGSVGPHCTQHASYPVVVVCGDEA
jgi:nucleotide-binding universal stress UspA family protein